MNSMSDSREFQEVESNYCGRLFFSNANRNVDTSAKRAQADSRKGLMSSSSQEPSAPGKPATLFSDGNKKPGKQLKSSIF